MLRYQPRPSISRVMPRKGQVSTCNAGARASPVDVPPTIPSRPGTTHHQGSGKNPLNIATNGFSTLSSLNIVLISSSLSCVLQLYRRARRIGIRAKHAAIALLWLQHRAAIYAFVKELASVNWHFEVLRKTAFRARQLRYCNRFHDLCSFC